jgi:hypothetical protein
MFGKCWSIPNPGPPLPTIITVQAPAGIGQLIGYFIILFIISTRDFTINSIMAMNNVF